MRTNVGLLLGLACLVLIAATVCVLVPEAAALRPSSALIGSPTPLPATPVVYQVLVVLPPTATPAPLPPPGPVAAVNQRILVANVTFEVRAPHWTTFSNYDLADQPGRRILVFEVLQESHRPDRRSRYGPDSYVVHDGDDFEYRAQTAPLDPLKGLRSGELAFGERVRGEVYFIVPSQAKGFTLFLYVALPPPSTDYQTVRVALGV